MSVRNDDTIYSLLERLSSRQINDLIIHCKVLNAGYEIRYLVDPFDLQNYCFPFGIEIEAIEDLQRIGEKADNTLGLHYIFDNPAIKLIIFNEYSEEILDFEWYVRQSIEKQSLAADAFWSAFNPKQLEVGSQEFFDKTNFSLLMAVSVVLYHEGLQKITHLRESIRDKRLVDEATDYSDPFFDTASWTVIFNCLPDLQFVDRVQEYLMSSTKIPKKFVDAVQPPLWFRREYKAKYRDSKAVDRALRINEQLHEVNRSGTTEKVLVAYLSSTNASKDLFLQPFIQERFPALPLTEQGSYFNPLRTAEQLFLLHLCDDREDKASTLGNLEMVYRLRRSQEVSGEYDPALLATVSGWMVDRLDVSRRNSRNYSLLDNIEQYKQETEALANRKGYEDQKKILDQLQTYVADNRKKIHEQKKEHFSLLNYEEMFLTILNLGLRKLREDKRLLSNYGQDRIKGLYHRLPVAFFTHQPETLHSLIKFMLEPDENKPQFGLNILETTKNLLDLEYDNPESEIARCLLILLFPKSDPETDLSHETQHSTDFPGSHEKNLREISIDPNYVVYSRLAMKIESPTESYPVAYKTDLLYILSWVARRLDRYEDAKRFTRMGIELDPKDPRFYHSQCLIEYCEYNEHKDPDERIRQLTSILSFATHAYELYAATEKDHPGNLAIQKSKAALKNTRIFLKCLLYELTQDSTYLDRSDQRLQELEAEERENFNLLSDFLHTKVSFLCCKIEALLSSGRFETGQMERFFSEGTETLRILEDRLLNPIEKAELDKSKEKFAGLQEQWNQEKGDKANQP